MEADLIPQFYDDLTAAYAQAWALMVRGKTDRRSAFHTPTLGTIDGDGAPQIRTVVLRDANQKHASLRFHTDMRSRKVAEIQAHSKVSLHFYDKKAKIQLRVMGKAILHSDDLPKQAAWQASKAMSRECYRVDKAPGTFVGESDDWYIELEPEDKDMGVENFVAVEVRLLTIEWLYLARGGHRRALFQLDSQGNLDTSQWMVP